MTNQWFYGRGSDITGPVSSTELAGLAASGQVLPSDTVWLEGRDHHSFLVLGTRIGTGVCVYA